jgi:hypothetical protein
MAEGERLRRCEGGKKEGGKLGRCEGERDLKSEGGKKEGGKLRR